MTIVDDCVPVPPARPTATVPHCRHTIRVGLLGLGRVGSAVARLAGSIGPWHVRPTAALVRDARRRREPHGVTVTSEAREIFADRPDVVVEALGGLEPARSLVLEALSRGIPVVTANKSLLAHHAEELLDASARAGVPLRYEASVIAGVPFLGTFAGRPHASRVTSIAGIVNGTTNFILSAMESGTSSYERALENAQRRGYAEPDPSRDVRGLDAVEKLAILIRQFYSLVVDPSAIETTGIEDVTPLDFAHARALGGTLKPVVLAGPPDPGDAAIAACAGPAFVPVEHPLARLRQATNGLCLRDAAGSQLCFSGPGAGPDVTAVTILDDVLEAVANGPPRRIPRAADAPAVSPSTPWLVRLVYGGALRAPGDVAAILDAHGVGTSRTSIRSAESGRWSHATLTQPCTKSRIERTVAAVAALTGSTARVYRALEPVDGY